MKQRLVSSLAALSLTLSGPVLAQAQSTPPIAGMTNQRAVAVLAAVVVGMCLQTRLKDQTITDLSEPEREGLHPATDADRQLSAGRGTNLPVWTTNEMGGLLTVTERSHDMCTVTVMQYPVERAAQTVMLVAQKLIPGLEPVQVTSSYNPTVYQLEMVRGGIRYIVHIEGAEPGLPGHLFRFSLLTIDVIRQPEDGKAPFR